MATTDKTPALFDTNRKDVIVHLRHNSVGAIVEYTIHTDDRVVTAYRVVYPSHIATKAILKTATGKILDIKTHPENAPLELVARQEARVWGV
jgi:hypothetical protein